MTYVVKPGDTLSKISAALLGSSSRWKEIWTANPAIYDPNLIRVGQVLNIPEVYGPPAPAGHNPDPSHTVPAVQAITSQGFDLTSMLSNPKVLIGAAAVGAMLIFVATKPKNRMASA